MATVATISLALALLGFLVFPLLLALSLRSPRLTMFWARTQSRKNAVILYSALTALSITASIAIPTLLGTYIPDSTASTTAPSEISESTIAPTDSENNLEQFMAWVRSIDSDSNIVTNAKVDPQYPETVEVTVTTLFLTQDKEIQRESAAGMQRAWASIVSPSEPDNARIWLRTPSGNRFGGSRAIAGSMIYIDN